MKTVLCYGDSNTYGYNPNEGHRSRYPKELRWTTILQELLGEKYEIIVEGLNGRTTAYDRPGFPWKNGLQPLAAILGSHKPIDYVVFMLGTNDCNVEMNLSSEDIAKGMERLIIKTRTMTIIQQEYIPNIIVVSPPPMLENYHYSPFSDQLDDASIIKSNEIGPLYKEISLKHDCVYVDAGKNDVEVSMLDCEHLTVNGHRTLANLVFNAIKQAERG